MYHAVQLLLIHFVAQHPKLYFYYFGVTTEDGSTHVIHANESMRGELSVDTDPLLAADRLRP